MTYFFPLENFKVILSLLFGDITLSRSFVLRRLFSDLKGVVFVHFLLLLILELTSSGWNIDFDVQKQKN